MSNATILNSSSSILARKTVNSQTMGGMLEAALSYAERGWAVFPVHTPTNGKCTCGKPDCTNIGKHPRTMNGLKDATTNIEQISKWWSMWPNANIGIATGEVSGLAILDVDIKPGSNGEETLEELEEQYGKLPDTVQVITGSGGRHLYFKHPGYKVKSPNGFMPGLDSKADGGYIIAPPSLHVSGNRYTQEASSHPADIELAQMPKWLIEKINKNSTVSNNVVTTGNLIPEGKRHATFVSLAGTMRKKGMSAASIEAALIAERDSRCENPQDFPDSEVKRIARDIGSKEPGEPEQQQSISLDFLEVSEWPILAPEALYGLAGDFVKVIEPHSEADPVALLVNILIAFGSVVGRSAYFEVESNQHYTNLYGVLVGKTAGGRKGTSSGYINKIFNPIDIEWLQTKKIDGGISTGEGIIERVKDPRYKDTDNGPELIEPGVTDKRLFIIEPEFASVLRVMTREGNTTSPVTRNGWDQDKLNILTRHNSLTASNAHLSILGHIVKDELLRYLNFIETSNGFANRFMFFCVRRSKSLPFGGKVEAHFFEPLVSRLKKAVEFAKAAKEIGFDNEAQEIFIPIYDELSKEKPGTLYAVTARAVPQVRRLAMIYALLDCSHVVKPNHLLAALALWDYSFNSAKFIFGSKTGNPMADTIISAIKGNPSNGLTRTDINGLFGGNKAKAEIESALKLLHEIKLIKPTIEQTAGRSSQVWYLC